MPCYKTKLTTLHSNLPLILSGTTQLSQFRRLRLTPPTARSLRCQHLLLATTAPNLIPQISTRRVNIHARRRHPQRGVLLEEITRAQHDTDRLRRHQREILQPREVTQAELQPDDDVGVDDVVVAVGPVGDGLVGGPAGLACGLADVVAGGEELVVAVRGDPERVPGEGGAAPDEAAGLAEEVRGLAGDDLVAGGEGAGGGEGLRVWVDDVPGAGGVVVVVAGLDGGFEEGLLVVEGVAVEVAGLADGDVGGDGVVLDHGVVVAVDGRVDAQGEDVLVVVRVEGVGDLRAVGGGFFVGVEGHGVEDAG